MRRQKRSNSRRPRSTGRRRSPRPGSSRDQSERTERWQKSSLTAKECQKDSGDAGDLAAATPIGARVMSAMRGCPGNEDVEVAAMKATLGAEGAGGVRRRAVVMPRRSSRGSAPRGSAPMCWSPTWWRPRASSTSFVQDFGAVRLHHFGVRLKQAWACSRRLDAIEAELCQAWAAFEQRWACSWPHFRGSATSRTASANGGEDAAPAFLA